MYDFNEKAREVIRICNDRGFMNHTVTPYGFGITVEELTRNWSDYDNCTADSKSVMRRELEGFLPILEAWIAYDNEPMVKVKLTQGPNAGTIKEHHESTAMMLIEHNMAIAV